MKRLLGHSRLFFPFALGVLLFGLGSSWAEAAGEAQAAALRVVRNTGVEEVAGTGIVTVGTVTATAATGGFTGASGTDLFARAAVVGLPRAGEASLATVELTFERFRIVASDVNARVAIGSCRNEIEMPPLESSSSMVAFQVFEDGLLRTDLVYTGAFQTFDLGTIRIVLNQEIRTGSFGTLDVERNAIRVLAGIPVGAVTYYAATARAACFKTAAE